MDKKSIYIIIAVVLLGILFWGWQAGLFAKIFVGKPVVVPEGIILFYGEGCPHCLVVEDFITKNKIDEKVKFTKLEVWYNEANKLVIAKVAKACGITANSIGVPFLSDGKGKCLVGDVDINNFFKNEAGIK